MSFPKVTWLLLTFAAVFMSGCYRFVPSDGGGQTNFSPPRAVSSSDIAVPPGYTIEAVATNLTFPTGVTFDGQGNVYVVEAGYSYGEVWTQPRLLKVAPDSTTEIARGGRNGPWNGVTFADGHFYIAEGGQLEGGRILKVTPEGEITRLVTDLPSLGDHHTNGPVAGPDNKIYFGQGTATNSGVVGKDNAKFGWLERFPQFHDTPCQTLSLTDQEFETSDALSDDNDATVVTGAFSAYGEQTSTVQAGLPCNGAIMSINADGTGLEWVAWGFRNPYGLAFAPNGELYVTDNGYDVRGSRPVWGTGDYLWHVQPGTWYGWPDYAGGQPLDSHHFEPPGGSRPSLLLQQPPNSPPSPAAVLGVHASANGLDFSRSREFGYVGQAFIAEFGDMSPDTGKSIHPVGFRVVRVDPETGAIEDFAVNKSSKIGPASKIGTNGLERPIAARFNPAGDTLYIVDFGVMVMTEKGPRPYPATGVLWKVTAGGSP